MTRLSGLNVDIMTTPPSKSTLKLMTAAKTATEIALVAVNRAMTEVDYDESGMSYQRRTSSRQKACSENNSVEDQGQASLPELYVGEGCTI